MIVNLKNPSLILLFLSLIFTSCRKEEIQSITPPEDTLDGNSAIAILMKRTATNDGSIDNIIDFANCFNIQLPISVMANSMAITLNSEVDYLVVESVFDTDDNDTDNLEISYPITIILSDFSEVIVNNYSELVSHANTCNGENENDDDIECIDFQYPISASIFNTNNELTSAVTLSNDNQLYDFINDIDVYDIIAINFPIIVILSDGMEMSVASLSGLESVIENAANDCDEDDDYDYNDDDCNTCTQSQLKDSLTSCPDWLVNRLKRSDVDYDDFYDGYEFNFFDDGTVSAYWNTTTAYGTWTTNGSANNISVTIDIPALNLCNNTWRLHEIENITETKIDLRVEEVDRLRYVNACN